MFELTLFPLVALALLELVTNLVTFSPVPEIGRGSEIASGWGYLAHPLLLGRPSCLWDQPYSSLQCDCDSPSAFPCQSGSSWTDEVIRLFMGPLGCSVKHLDVILQQLARPDLSQQSVP